MIRDRVDVFGTGITFSGRSDASQAVAGLSRVQLCAVLRNSDISYPNTSTVAARLQASAAVHLNSVVFWDVTQCRLVSTFRYYIPVPIQG
jgi:hypothetical protein